MTKTLRLFALPLTILALAIAGCGGGSSGSDNSPKSSGG
jgi:hypothetical protein